jgi:hypothetical protein
MLDEEVVAFDSGTMMLHHLNVPASMFWSACDGIRTVGEIACAIAARSGLSQETVETQVLDLVDALVARDLLILDACES